MCYACLKFTSLTLFKTFKKESVTVESRVRNVNVPCWPRVANSRRNVKSKTPNTTVQRSSNGREHISDKIFSSCSTFFGTDETLLARLNKYTWRFVKTRQTGNSCSGKAYGRQVTQSIRCADSVPGSAAWRSDSVSSLSAGQINLLFRNCWNNACGRPIGLLYIEMTSSPAFFSAVSERSELDLCGDLNRYQS